MAEKTIHSFSLDCRGTGYGSKLVDKNIVTVTKVFEEVKNIYTEVGCFFLGSDTECKVTGAPCSHLRPVVSRR